MRTPKEAREEVLARIQPPEETAIEEVPLAASAGRVLARSAVSDVDLPPFEKSMMDGYGLRAADAAEPGARLPVVGESRAGVPFDGRVPPGAALEIFTGAQLPDGLDAVEMVEHTRREGGEVLLERAVRAGQNVSHVGEILREGGEVLPAGRRLAAADLALLASAGVDPVPVWRRPVVSVLTTGDELVPPAERPGPGQIREGNTLYLAAACARVGCEVRRAGIVPDDPDALREAFAQALEEGDALVTTGGVSVGKYDLVGAAFESVGVEPVLHKVAIKPGKPIWFGLAGRRPVFGLPGNPVSSLLGFEVFVRPALARLGGAGEEEQAERLERGRWTGPERRAGDRQVNLPARCATGADGVRELVPVPFRGSADVVAGALAEALVVVPPGETIAPGQLVDFRPLLGA